MKIKIIRDFVYSIILLHLIVLTGWAQTIWSGPKISFEKQDSTNWSLAENQDRISDSVWLTRAHQRGIFNIRREAEYNKETNISPMDTEWANGSIADGIENLVFTTWFNSFTNHPADEIGKPKVLHLISEDIYLDLTFRKWTAGGGGSGTGFGGGFSYERSTPTTTSVHLSQPFDALRIYPNPASTEIRISSPEINSPYEIIDAVGNTVKSGINTMNTNIPLEDLAPGWYLIKSKNRLGKFLKI